MKIKMMFFMAIFTAVFLVTASAGSSADGSLSATIKKKILVVSSYDRSYLWSQETNRGLCAALRDKGYFDNEEEIKQYTETDNVETAKTVIKKMWMDAKRKQSETDLANAAMEVVRVAKEFKPDIILLGDDDAANYVGNQFLDSAIPVVFWGVNNTPVKYGLLDSIENPGHNVTGIYQSGYYRESMELLKRMVPGAGKIAVLSDDTSSGRSHVKMITFLSESNGLPFDLVGTVATENLDEFKDKALELEGKADAFFVAQYSGLKDKDGKTVPAAEVAKWYTDNINLPEAVSQKQFVQQGMLCAVDDSGYKQGYEAGRVADDILKGAKPATYRPYAPGPGKSMVNKKRAEILGIQLTPAMGVEEYVDAE